MSKELTPDEIIDALGGTGEVAKIFDIAPPSVSEWRKKGIPSARMMYIRVVWPDFFTRPAKFRKLAKGTS